MTANKAGELLSRSERDFREYDAGKISFPQFIKIVVAVLDAYRTKKYSAEDIQKMLLSRSYR